jgi:hypothetical protein
VGETAVSNGPDGKLTNKIASVLLRHKPVAKRWLQLAVINHSYVLRIVGPLIASD